MASFDSSHFILGFCIYIQENKDWNYDNKFKYGFTSNPANRIISEQHSYKSSYIAFPHLKSPQPKSVILEILFSTINFFKKNM